MDPSRHDRVHTRQDQFVVLYEANYDHIHAYVHRRLAGSGSDVCDVVADVFTVAWRRLDVVPPPPEDRLWLYGVARRVILRHRRSLTRRIRLRARLMGEALSPMASDASTDMLHLQIRAAIGRLRPKDREVVRLVLWERLSHAEAAQVLGCSVNAVTLRLHRAKTRLRADLALDAPLSPTTYPITSDPTRS
jgi:RNA polymerase sigma-70 factor, ECF subfamily